MPGIGGAGSFPTDDSTAYASGDSSTSNSQSPRQIATPLIRARSLKDIDCCSDASDCSSVASIAPVVRKPRFNDVVETKVFERKVPEGTKWHNVDKNHRLTKERRAARDSIPDSSDFVRDPLDPDWWHSHNAMQEARANAYSLWADLASEGRVPAREAKSWPVLLSRDGSTVLRYCYGQTRSEGELTKDDVRCKDGKHDFCSIYRTMEPIERAASDADRLRLRKYIEQPASAPRKGHVGGRPVSCGNRASRATDHLSAEELAQPGDDRKVKPKVDTHGEAGQTAYVRARELGILYYIADSGSGHHVVPRDNVRDNGLEARLSELDKTLSFETAGGRTECEHTIAISFPVLDERILTAHVLDDTPPVISMGVCASSMDTTSTGPQESSRTLRKMAT